VVLRVPAKVEELDAAANLYQPMTCKFASHRCCLVWYTAAADFSLAVFMVPSETI